jgi:hypothetical protein
MPFLNLSKQVRKVGTAQVKRLLLGLLFTAAASFAVPASASAAEYYFDVSCGLTADSTPSHVCESDDQIGAFFASDEDTEYEVCVEFPNEDFVCGPEESASANVLYVNELTTDQLGVHGVSWWVGEEEVGFWDVEVVQPPPPPAPPVLPAPVPAPTPPAVAPAVSAACIKAKLKVRKLNQQTQKADAGKQKAKLRAQLRRSKAAAKRAC